MGEGELLPVAGRGLTQRCSDALERAIDGLGRPDFVGHVFDLVDAIAGVDHCSLFAVHRTGARCLGANSADASGVAQRAAERYVAQHWAHDPALRRLRAGTGAVCEIQRIVPEQIHDRAYRRDCYVDANICDKVAVTVGAGEVRILLSAYRDTGSGMFSDGSLDGLTRYKDLLGRLARKQFEMTPPLDMPPSARQTRETVEGVLERLGRGLTPREIAVLARLATGMTAEAVGLDLGIMPSSIATYRKRGYARLGITGQPELFALLLAARSPLVPGSA